MDTSWKFVHWKCRFPQATVLRAVCSALGNESVVSSQGTFVVTEVVCFLKASWVLSRRTPPPPLTFCPETMQQEGSGSWDGMCLYPQLTVSLVFQYSDIERWRGHKQGHSWEGTMLWLPQWKSARLCATKADWFLQTRRLGPSHSWLWSCRVTSLVTHFFHLALSNVTMSPHVRSELRFLNRQNDEWDQLFRQSDTKVSQDKGLFEIPAHPSPCSRLQNWEPFVRIVQSVVIWCHHTEWAETKASWCLTEEQRSKDHLLSKWSWKKKKERRKNSGKDLSPSQNWT